MQLWWGNAFSESMLKLEYCVKHPTTNQNDPLHVAEHLLGDVASMLSEQELEDSGCKFTTDLSGLFRRHGAAPSLHLPPPVIGVPLSVRAVLGV